MMLLCMKSPVTMHQMTVKQAKDGQLIPKALLEKCREEARQKVPQILDELENTNATKTSNTYLINVNLHKTNQAFGPAQIALSAEEYCWFERFLAMREELVGGAEAKLIFFTSSTNPCKNLNSHFQAAWKQMGLPKCPTFTDLRSAIATRARNNSSVEDRTKLSRFMCHDTRTAAKFYACNFNAKEAWEHRQLFEKVLEGPDEPIGKVGKKPCKRKRGENASPLTSQTTTSEDEAEPVYQESGVSSVEEGQSPWSNM